MIHQPPKHIHYRISTIFQKQNDETTPDLMLRNKTKSDWPSLPFKKPKIKIKIKIAQNFTNTKRNETDPLEIPNQPLQQIKTLPFSAFFLSFFSLFLLLLLLLHSIFLGLAAIDSQFKYFRKSPKSPSIFPLNAQFNNITHHRK